MRAHDRGHGAKVFAGTAGDGLAEYVGPAAVRLAPAPMAGPRARKAFLRQSASVFVDANGIRRDVSGKFRSH